ncbi:hypothetical protein [Eremococcus coleocola]|uniref:hypothetical protein n=1 Tax=Eremococcus coleocola TaxID=88132 RepID=UPI0003FF84C8|nr:hypothetical protein [Eremococcus coleocola]
MSVYKLTQNKKPLVAGNLIITYPDGRVLDFNKNISTLVASRPKTITRIRQRDLYTFKGRDGYTAIDNGTDEANEIDVEITVIAKNEDEFEKTLNVLDNLRLYTNLRFHFYHDPYAEYEGMIESIELQGGRQYKSSQKGTLKLRLQPARYPFVSQRVYTLSNGDSFQYDFGQLKPIFELSGSGDIQITADEVITLKAVPSGETLYIDSLVQKIYSKPSPNTYRNQSHLKYTYPYPVLPSGQRIKWSGEVTSLKVTPNWRL